LQESISERGFYMFPAKQGVPDEQFAEQYEKGPVGLVVYRPTGFRPTSIVQRGIQFGTNLLASLVAAFIASRCVGGIVTRVMVVSSLGIIAWLSVNVPYWNWYSFPPGMTIASLINHVIGWALVGVVLAVIVKRPTTTVKM